MEEKSSTQSQKKTKKGTWKVLNSFFRAKWAQKTLLRIHWIFYKKGRQQYHLGWVAPGRTLKEVEEHLSGKWGFVNNFVAWVDKGQVSSLRKFDGTEYQFHIRIFTDGEMRGHYEYTPESKPFEHLFEVNEEKRGKDFDTFLGHYMVKEKHISSFPISE